MLDLRREPMQRNLRLRHRAAMAVRRFLDEHGFVDIETPCSTSRRRRARASSWCRRGCMQGHFYALPQSPQLFKQMLMVAGFDRYYQIVKCFRDEDLRADRQPEFTQIDIETSFLVGGRHPRADGSAMCASCSARRSASSCPRLFPVLTYDEAMRDYGTDKPDLRIPLKLAESPTR